MRVFRACRYHCKFLVAIIVFLGCFCTSALASEPFKIGYCVSLSGVYEFLGRELRDGLNLYMEQIGHKAGGRDLEVKVKNIGSNQVTWALDEAYKLIDKDKVDVIAGVVDSGCAYALAELINQHQIPFVISNAGADDLTQRKANPFIVRVSFGNSAGSHPLGTWAYEQGFRKAVAIGPANAAGYENVGGICNTFKKMGGEVVQELWTRLGTQDFKPLIAQIKPEADVALVFFAGGDAIRFVEQFAESGLKGKLAIVAKGFLVDENVLSKTGAKAEGIFSESHWSPLVDTPENTEFKAAFARKYGRQPTLYAEQGYVTGMLIAEALNKTKGQAKGQDFVKVMRSLELKAPRGSIKFDQYGGIVQSYHIRKVQQIDGQWQNAIIKTYPFVSQFWIWTPEQFMQATPYAQMKDKWTTSQP